jgi:hypothetical protein
MGSSSVVECLISPDCPEEGKGNKKKAEGRNRRQKAGV